MQGLDSVFWSPKLNHTATETSTGLSTWQKRNMPGPPRFLPTMTEISHDNVDMVTIDDNDVRLNVELLELRIYRLIAAKNLETVFQNTVITCRIYLILMITNCSGERSFAK